MSYLQELRIAHLLGALSYGLAGGCLWVLAMRGSAGALIALVAFAMAVVITAWTWDRIVREEYR